MATAELARLSLRSGFVFAGLVEQTGATTVDLVEPTKETAIVRVERVLRAPGDFGQRKGSKVTVRLGAPARKGQRAVFFTIGWISGKSLAVQEIGRQPAGDLDAIKQEMEDAVRQQETAVLRKRVAAASAIVIGTVADTRPVGKRELPPASEHDPQWRIAVIEVERVVKGDVKEGGRLELAYPSSEDVMWFRAPKPEPGEQGVFLAHQRRLEEHDRTVLAIEEPLDLQSVQELELIRSVMSRK